MPPTIPARRTKKSTRLVVLSRIVKDIGSISYLKNMPAATEQSQLISSAHRLLSMLFRGPTWDAFAVLGFPRHVRNAILISIELMPTCINVSR